MGSVGIGMFGFRAFRSRLEIKPHRELGLPRRGRETGRAKGRVGGARNSAAELLRTGPANALLNTRHGLFFHRCPPTCGTHYLRRKEGGNTRKTLEIVREQAGYGLLLCTATNTTTLFAISAIPKASPSRRDGTSGTECDICTRVRGRACGAIQVGVPLGSDVLANHASVGGESWVICSASFPCF